MAALDAVTTFAAARDLTATVTIVVNAVDVDGVAIAAVPKFGPPQPPVVGSAVECGAFDDALAEALDNLRAHLDAAPESA